MNRNYFAPGIISLFFLSFAFVPAISFTSGSLIGFPGKGSYGIDINYPGTGFRYLITDNKAVELRGQFDADVSVVGLRGYYFYIATQKAPLIFGIETDYIRYSGTDARSHGFAGAAFIGLEVLVYRRFSVQFDFGPAWIYLTDRNYDGSVNGVEYVVNLGLNYYLKKRNRDAFSMANAANGKGIGPLPVAEMPLKTNE